MLYFEDFLEIIEHLPQELRDMFTEIRELDLQVHNNNDKLDEQLKILFANADTMKESDLQAEYNKLVKGYEKTLEDCEEKINIANQATELLERYKRKFDQEISKFSMELEADNPGITEILEKRSFELDNPQPPPPPTNSNLVRSEKKKLTPQNISISYTPDQQTLSDKLLSSISVDALKETLGSSRLVHPGRSPSSSSTSSTSSASSFIDRPLILAPQTKGAFGSTSALAAAASVAIAATQQTLKRGNSQNQSSSAQAGRRTASLKATYEAYNAGNIVKELSLGGSSLMSIQPSLAGSLSIASKSVKRVKTSAEPVVSVEDSGDSSVLDDASAAYLDGYDPNEPRYCICNQVSYGDMVGCDNKDCPIEWFHYPCVGITQTPKGKWFCPQCSNSMKRKNRKDK